MSSAQLVQSSDWPSRFFNPQKPCGIGSSSSVILLILCVLSRALIIIPYPRSQVASEKAELLAALIEYEKDINLLESLYNSNKELLDQHNLDTDLKELAEYAESCFPFAAEFDNEQNRPRPRRMAELDQSKPGQEEGAGSQGTVEIRRSAREIVRIKCKDQ